MADAEPKPLSMSQTREQVILRYLQRQGYKDAERVFAKEARVQDLSALKISPQLDADMAIVNHVLFYPEAEKDGRGYIDCYTQLRAWVHSSLDLYKAELERILYPIFVHSYLDLVERGHTQCAAELLERFRPDHEEQHGQYVKSLSKITLPEHVKEDKLAQLYRENKSNVKLSAYAWELLLSFLHSSKTLLLLGLINERLGVTLVAGAPEQDDGSADFGADAVTLTGETTQRQLDMNQKAVRWGALQKTNVELKAAKIHKDDVTEKKFHELEAVEAAKSSDMSQPADFRREFGAAKRSRKDIQQESKRAGEDAADDLVGPLLKAPKVETKVPLPKMREEEELASIAEIRKRVRVSGRAPPSCAFFTCCNTYDGLNVVAISADGQRVAGGFADSQVRVWSNDADAAKVVTEAGKVAGARPAVPHMLLCGHSAPVYGLDFSPDGEHLLSCSTDFTVRLWSLELQACLCVYTGHAYPVWDVKWSPMGHYFATASHDRTARLWATNRHTPLRVFAGHLADVDCLAFHPNANYVATGSSDKTVRLWDVQSGDCARLLTGHRGTVTSVAVSPAGRVLVSGDSQGMILCWDLANGRRFGAFGGPSSAGHAGPVWSLAFSGESAVLASGGDDCSIGLWDVEGGVPDDAQGTGHGAGGASGAGAESKPWRGDARLITMLRTKQTPVMAVRFTRRNLLLGAGAFTRGLRSSGGGASGRQTAARGAAAGDKKAAGSAR